MAPAPAAPAAAAPAAAAAATTAAPAAAAAAPNAAAAAPDAAAATPAAGGAADLVDEKVRKPFEALLDKITAALASGTPTSDPVYTQWGKDMEAVVKLGQSDGGKIIHNCNDCIRRTIVYTCSFICAEQLNE